MLLIVVKQNTGMNLEACGMAVTLKCVGAIYIYYIICILHLTPRLAKLERGGGERKPGNTGINGIHGVTLKRT